MADDEVSLGAGARDPASGGAGAASGSDVQDSAPGWTVQGTLSGPDVQDTVPGSDVQDTVPGSDVQHRGDDVALGAPPADTGPGVLEAVRSAFAGATAGRALGWVLLVWWAVVLVAVWVAQPRLVPQDFLAGDLAQGRITAYRLVTVDEDTVRGPLSGPYDINLSPASEPTGALDDTGLADADGRPVTIGYWVDSPVAAVRVLDPDAFPSDTPAVVASLRSAGVPEAAATLLYRDSWAQRIRTSGALLLLATTLVVVLGPRPRRGTRWFWFWVTGGPIAVGVPAFAVAELLRPRQEAPGTVHPPGVAGRWSGAAGFWLGMLVSVGGGILVSTLAGWSPIWFVRT